MLFLHSNSRLWSCPWVEAACVWTTEDTEMGRGWNTAMMDWQIGWSVLPKWLKDLIILIAISIKIFCILRPMRPGLQCTLDSNKPRICPFTPNLLFQSLALLYKYLCSQVGSPLVVDWEIPQTNYRMRRSHVGGLVQIRDHLEVLCTLTWWLHTAG